MSAEPIAPALEETQEVPRFETPAVAPPSGWALPITRGQLLALAGLILLALVPIPFGTYGFYVGAYALVYVMIGLSVTVVTGYAGLISLMPYSFAGVGGLITGMAMASWGWPFWLCIPLAAVATVPISILVGVISVRLKGLYLAIATLTIAAMLGETFFTWSSVRNADVGWVVNRPTPFVGDRVFYVLCLAAALILVFMIEGLRTSKLGRAMLAVRDNEREAEALGINVMQTKLAAFVIGGMMAGVGGAFLALLLQNIGGIGVTVFQSPQVDAVSIILVSLVVVGGIDRAWGAFFGAIVLVVQRQVFNGAEFFFSFVGIYSALLLITFLLFRPGGLLQIGKLQLQLIKERPAFGSAVVAGILGLNLGVAWLFVKLS
ncbi:MAG: branched-chain amino acid ABC transporter permease [Actinomycetota bacterium]